MARTVKPSIKLVKAQDAKPPQRFGRDVIEGSMLWKEFIRALKSVGPNQYLEFCGPKTKVQRWRRKIIKHIVASRLPIYTYVVTNDGASQTMYVCGK